MNEPNRAEIQVATSRDATLIIKLLKRLRQESSTVEIDPHVDHLTPQQEAQQISLINHTRDNVIMVAHWEKRLIGIITIQKQNLFAGEVGLAVEKRFWRHGLGTALLEEAIRWFKSFSSLKDLVLTVKERNYSALRLYLKEGFKIVPLDDQSFGLIKMIMKK